MRTPLLIALAALAAALPLSVTAPLSAAQARVSDRSGPFAFGDTAVIAYPTGAYPGEYAWDDLRDVGFRIDTVERSGPGSVRYRLTVDVPELGRVLGLGGLEPRCLAEGTPTGAPRRLPGSAELEAGTHTYALGCPVPADTDTLEIRFTQRDARGDDVLIVFTGPAPT